MLDSTLGLRVRSTPMSKRFFAADLAEATSVALEGSEAHHLIHVLRASAGDLVTLFDGSGAEFEARVERVGRAQAQLAVLARHTPGRESPVACTLAVALPKGERQGWLIEKAVELGVARVVPLKTSRSVAQPLDAALERLRRAVVEASKQCGRNRLMEISPAADFADFVTREAGGIRMLAHPRGSMMLEDLARIAPERGSGVCFAVGPEGGFTDDEIAVSAAAGWRTLDMGPRLLRIETAAIALAAISAALVASGEMRPKSVPG